MTGQSHWRGLERCYIAAPINTIYRPRIAIAEGACEIEIDLPEQLHHAAGAVHGSVYFKMLDDAAFFAANSMEPDVFMLTTSFTTYLTRPVSEGVMRAEGRLVNQNRSQMVAESVVYDADGREIGRGSGLFVRSKVMLRDVPGYPEGSAG